MGKVTYGVLSGQNGCAISKYRYFELKYFCFQYPEWKRRLSELDGLATRGKHAPTETEAFEKLELTEKIKMVQDTVEVVGEWCKDALLDCVTEGIPYDKLNARNPIPCGRELFYKTYRKFFYVLSCTRK